MLLVGFFCFLIANSQYFVPEYDHPENPTELTQQDKNDPASDQRTFLDVAVDAVVPFATVLANGTMQLIYEVIGFEDKGFHPQASMAIYPSHFLEILLERIISTNAP